MKIQVVTTRGDKAKVPLWYPSINLDHLAKGQREIVQRMLYEESGAFRRDDNDIRCIPSLQMLITLKYDIPVQRPYLAVPKPLFNEVKRYMHPGKRLDHQLKVTIHCSSCLCPQERWQAEALL